jgi:hypothetical protein
MLESVAIAAVVALVVSGAEVSKRLSLLPESEEGRLAISAVSPTSTKS